MYMYYYVHDITSYLIFVAQTALTYSFARLVPRPLAMRRSCSAMSFA